MKIYKSLLPAFLSATTLLFIPIFALAEQAITHGKDIPSNATQLTRTNSLVEPGAITEQWKLTFDGGQGQGNLTLIRKQDGSITADGYWVYTYQGSGVSGLYTEAPVTIENSSLSISASGIATNPSIPPGYNTSPFTLNIIGTAKSGQGNGSFDIAFQAVGWPSRILGGWEGIRTSGNGITAETAKSNAMPWLFLLLQ